MRSLPFVDESKIGIHGVSWGGVITSNVIGVDTRFAFAIPTYGCGHMWDGVGKWQEAIFNAGGTNYYKNVWDSMLWLENATMPIMWLTWRNDSTFNLDSQANSYNKAPGTKMVSIIQGMRHSHAFTWSRADSYDFADSIVGNNSASVGVSVDEPWCVQRGLSLVGDQIEVEFESTKELASATLFHSDEMGDSKAFAWSTVTLADFAETSPGSGIWRGTVTLPSEATAWYINVTATTSILTTAFLDSTEYTSETIHVSTRLQEVVTIQQPDALEMSLPSGGVNATGEVGVDFTAIYNLEITAIDFINETHSGAFSTEEEFIFGLLTDTPFAVTFDNTVAGLATGEVSAATLRLTWVGLDNVTTDTIDIPLSATVSEDSVSAYTWDGGGGNNRWTTSANWLDDISPSNNSLGPLIDVVISDVGGRTTSNTYANFTLRSLTFDSSVDDPFAINVFRSSSFVRTLTFDFGGSRAEIVVDDESSGDILFDDFDASGAIILNDDLDLVHDGTGTLTFALTIGDEIGESNGITSSGSGVVSLQGKNTYTGDTIVAAGTLRLESGSSLSFVPMADGVSNQLAGASFGTGTVHLGGELNLDLESAERTLGSRWVLIDESDLNVVFDAESFSVNSTEGIFSHNGGVWSLDAGGHTWIFSEETGILEIAGKPYEIWVEGSFTYPFTGTEPLDDFDGDGFVNYLEFVLGGDPTIFEAGMSPSITVSGDEFIFAFTRSDLSKEVAGSTVRVELSEDISFSTVENNVQIGELNDGGPIGALGASFTASHGDGLDIVLVTIPRAGFKSLFARLVVTLPLE